MKFAVAQLDYTVGNFHEILRKKREAFDKAQLNGVDLLIFTELSICGYPPRDLLDRPQFITDVNAAITKVQKWTDNSSTAILLGAPTQNPLPKTKYLHNSALLIQEGKILAQVPKMLLCTYDIYDESRYFQPGVEGEVIKFKNIRLGVSVCEDIWNDNIGYLNVIYPDNPISQQVRKGCDVLVNLSASPWFQGKEILRTKMIAGIARKYNTPTVYANQVAGNDEILFDGHSLVFDAKGNLRHLGKAFEEDFIVIDIDELAQTRITEHVEISTKLPEIPTNNEDFDLELLYKGLVLGTRDYVHKCGFSKVAIGLSGGIDSALVTKIAVDALGKENVKCFGMPTRFSSEGSILDSEKLAKKLDVSFEIVEIDEIFANYLQITEKLFPEKPFDVAEENLQARIRGNILMAIANKTNALVLVTSNKSELAVGYCTIYGDMSGAFAPIADVYKTVVYKLSRFLNRNGEIIPESIITKPPSAELKPDQTDQDNLPEYEILDRILFLFLEKHLDLNKIMELTGFDKSTIERVINLVYISEYKRKQSAPTIKTSNKAFGIGRRYPIASKYLPPKRNQD
ncbi:MAG: NAD+ synthase [Planctomycetes bacterium]|nr:NAD+ synthase [Planctomycetota bacterium]